MLEIIWAIFYFLSLFRIENVIDFSIHILYFSVNSKIPELQKIDKPKFILNSSSSYLHQLSKP